MSTVPFRQITAAETRQYGRQKESQSFSGTGGDGVKLLTRWKYRFIVWFFDRPDSLNRRVEVEVALLAHYKRGASPTPEQCKDLAFRLGVPGRLK